MMGAAGNPVGESVITASRSREFPESWQSPHGGGAMFFLTSIVDRPVEGKTGEPIGRIEDVIVRMGDDRYPPISGLVVRDGRRRFFVSANLLQKLNGSARLSSSTVDLQTFTRRAGEVLLRR